MFMKKMFTFLIHFQEVSVNFYQKMFDMQVTTMAHLGAG